MGSPIRPRSTSLVSSQSSASSTAGDSSSGPKWLNPCRIQPHALDPNRDFLGAPEIEDDKLFEEILQAARRSKSQADDTMRKFLKILNNNDATFVNATEEFRQDWLPKILEPTEAVFKQYSVETWYKKTFEYLQYFAVGIEQILLDKVLHDGKMVQDFKQTEYFLYQLLCELQLAMYIKGIKADTDVLRNAMSQKYRDIQNDSRRDLRDYLILRDYIKMLNFTEKVFAYLKSA